MKSQSFYFRNILVVSFWIMSIAVFAAGNEAFLFQNQSVKGLISIDKSESSCVRCAVGMFAKDVGEITGCQPQIVTSLPPKGNVVVVGQWGKSKLISYLTEQHRLSFDTLTGAWEAFTIRQIEDHGRKILMVCGSDRRGTAYGILELSRMLNVSPWVWWADVRPQKKAVIRFDIPYVVYQKPSVQYRAIFLNDEDWGLKPWASKTIDPTLGELGPRTYRRIFELMLRLRVNTIWPAMHECTKPFYQIEGNASLADSMGIVVSTSHCEPMMCSNPREWNKEKNGEYNFFSNRKAVDRYWEDRLSEVASYENIYSTGMRGIHDGAMEGARTIAMQVDGLTKVFADQRQLLAKYLHKQPNQIPQIFIPYKEVLDAYQAGLQVPDDITLIWCDDNYGYLTRLSDSLERKRSGGAGVYYHVSYWGRPHDYLWLATTQPAFMYTEMKRAWDYGARKMWILNVGDIKPAEYLTQYFMDIAWSMQSAAPGKEHTHLGGWIEAVFGNRAAPLVTAVMNEYYRLAFIRRPEFMGWSQTEPTTAVRSTELSLYESGNEVAARIEQYDSLENRALRAGRMIDSRLKDAYFQLVLYPVVSASAMNKKWLYAQWANELYRYNLPGADAKMAASLRAYQRIQDLTGYYNDTLQSGKWKYMMSAAPRRLPVFGKPVFTQPETSKTLSPDSLKLLLAPSGKTGSTITHFGAADFSSMKKSPTGWWEEVPGLGYSSHAMVLQPFGGVLSNDILNNPMLEYSFHSQSDSVRIDLCLVPTRDVSGGKNMRIAISVDGGSIQIFNINTSGRTAVWKENVLRNQATIHHIVGLKKLPHHHLNVYAVDPDVILDEIKIDSTIRRKYYGILE